MIVVDTSVWVANLRNMDCEPVRKLEALERQDDTVVGDLVLLEILQGARDDAHAVRLETQMRQFEIVAMLTDDLAVGAARHFRRLRSLGVTVRKTVDLMIATFCIDHGCPLLHDDRDFDPFVQHLGMRCL